MLKTTGLAKSSRSRVHNTPFNTLTLSLGATKQLSDKQQSIQSSDPPEHYGTGAVYQDSQDI